MIFDLENSNGGEWFTFFTSKIKEDGTVVYDEPEEGAGRVCFRVADTDSIEKIYNQTRTTIREWVWPKNDQGKVIGNPVRASGYDQTATQEKKERELIWDYAIVDWEGLNDAKGKPIPVTLENKLKLMKIQSFARFAARCLQLISTATAEKKEAEIENLSPGTSG